MSEKSDSKMTSAQVNAAAREGIRLVLMRRSLPKSEYDKMTVRTLRTKMEDALGFVVKSESLRILHLNLSIGGQCRQKGWIVKVPPKGWYQKKTNQAKKVSSIGQYILSKPMGQVKRERVKTQQAKMKRAE
jgi:hypothetical protein